MGALSGRTVVVTRASHQAEEFIGLLKSRGARSVAIPTIEIVPPESWEQVDRAVDGLTAYDWLILTSVNGVRFFLDRAREVRGNLDLPSDLKICAVGPKTAAAIKRRRLPVTFMPTEHVAEAILEESDRDQWKGKRVLFARAAEGRNVIPEGLEGMGAVVDTVAVYRNVKPEGAREKFRKVFAAGGADVITFSSGSTARNFADLFSKEELLHLLEDVTVACIGPVTAAVAEEAGLTVDVMPRDYTLAALVDALEAYLGDRGIQGAGRP